MLLATISNCQLSLDYLAKKWLITLDIKYSTIILFSNRSKNTLRDI